MDAAALPRVRIAPGGGAQLPQSGRLLHSDLAAFGSKRTKVLAPYPSRFATVVG